jgi:hypothetical protein
MLAPDDSGVAPRRPVKQKISNISRSRVPRGHRRSNAAISSSVHTGNPSDFFLFARALEAGAVRGVAAHQFVRLVECPSEHAPHGRYEMLGLSRRCGTFPPELDGGFIDA